MNIDGLIGKIIYPDGVVGGGPIYPIYNNIIYIVYESNQVWAIDKDAIIFAPL